MIDSLLLVQGTDVKKEAMTVSLSNAKQIVIGRVPHGIGSGWMLHVAATTLADLDKAVLKFAKAAGVTGVAILLIRS